MAPQPERAPRHVRNPRGEGDRLRDELIAAADRLLRGGQSHESLSLRAVAREVGIAATSVYLHFPDKFALLLAVYRRHFAELGGQIARAIAEHDDPAGQLRAAALAYWHFAEQNPSAYYVMFTVPGSNAVAEPLPDDIRPGIQIIQAMQEVMTRCIAAGLISDLDPYCATLCLWTSLHGLLTMIAARPHVPWPARDALLDTLLATYIRSRG